MDKALAHIADDGRDHGLYEQAGTVRLPPLKMCVADFADEFGCGESYVAIVTYDFACIK